MAVPATPRSNVASLLSLPAAERSRRLAALLIGVKRSPTGFEAIRGLAAEALAYHSLNPYPWYHFREWKVEERGPYPKCMPFGRTAVKRSARWLFGKPLQINVPADKRLETFLRQAWQDNRMPTRMVAAATRAGFEGGLALKFAFDETASPKLSIQTLSVTEDVRTYYDPHDRDLLLMARVQYPYWDPVDGEWYFYREEWTAEAEVHYFPIKATFQTPSYMGIRFPPIAVTSDGGKSPDDYEHWEIDTKRSGANPFGVIPIVPVKNLDADEPFGMGDLWGLFRVIDRVNLTYHLMDKSNQFDSEPNLIFKDIDAERTDIDRPLAPGQPLSVKSDETLEGKDAQGEVILLEARGHLRPAMLEYAKDLRKQVLLDSGSVEVDQAEITNKGNMTQAVLTQVYAPLIELTGEKRKTYGEDGVCKFLELVAVGLKNAGMPVDEVAGVDPGNHETYDVQIGWPDYFALTEDEKTAQVTRVEQEVGAGLNTHERAIETVARVENIEDVGKLKDELKATVNAAEEGRMQRLGPQPEEPAKPARFNG